MKEYPKNKIKKQFTQKREENSRKLVIFTPGKTLRDQINKSLNHFQKLSKSTIVFNLVPSRMGCCLKSLPNKSQTNRKTCLIFFSVKRLSFLWLRINKSLSLQMNKNKQRDERNTKETTRLGYWKKLGKNIYENRVSLYFVS